MFTGPVPLALLLLLAGCSMTAGERWDKVQNIEWVLRQIEDAPPLAGAEVSLTFGVGRLYGRAANRYNARYTRTEQTLKIDGVAATKMYSSASPAAAEQETRYLKLLEQVDGYEFTGDRLELRRGSATILSFRPRVSTARS